MGNWRPNVERAQKPEHETVNVLKRKTVYQMIVFVPSPGISQGVEALLNCLARKLDSFWTTCCPGGVQDER
jgi:hypothetical protein